MSKLIIKLTWFYVNEINTPVDSVTFGIQSDRSRWLEHIALKCCV